MTLEKSKGYGLEQKTQTLLDLSRNRLNNPTPHQAPQRERVSAGQVPNFQGRRRRTKRWKELLRPDVNMGVPSLMMILEPNIIWDHTKGYVSALGKEVESLYCPEDFFDGWHKAGRLAHGVYEGNYWDLLGDCDEMIDMLKKMSKAPPLLEEPPLELPPSPELPKWDDFKPMLQALPSAPEETPVKLPPFRAPILDTEIPFIEPAYHALPDVPDAAREEPQPIFMPPEPLKIDAFVEPEFVNLDPPVLPDAPRAPTFGNPKHGHDWSGMRPFFKDLPPFVAPDQMAERSWLHPPLNLPALPLMEEMRMDKADMDLDPIPKLELAWESGPEPEPSYASIQTSPRMSRTPSRAPSPPRSPPKSPSHRPSTSSLGIPPLGPSRPASAGPAGPSGPITGPSAGPSPGPSTAVPTPAATRPNSAVPQKGDADLHAAWEELADVEGGKPRVWLNFDKPFADLPPIFMPPRPEPGREPRLTDFQLDDGGTGHGAGADEEIPEFRPPEGYPQALPPFQAPSLYTPKWVAPCEPRPIGFMRGTAPVLVIDVSGTMNPKQQGKFKEMKECVCTLLEPEGELGTAAAAFDVIAFCSGAWSWSSTYESRLNLLQSSQVFYSGRQVGGKVRPDSSKLRGDKTKSGAQLQPTEPDLLADAQNWVAKWPDAVGHTSLLGAFMTADEHWSADCWYIFSDGLADDPQQCVDFIDARIRHGQKVPVIHAIGFPPDGAPTPFRGEEYLKQLAAMTSGTYQQYKPDLHRIYQDGVGFVPYSIEKETAEDKIEREWAEQQLRAERKKNIRLGIIERLDVTMARVQALHSQMRVQPAVAANAELMALAEAEYEASVAHIKERNRLAYETAQAEYIALVESIKMRNRAKRESAHALYDESHRQWQEDYEARVSEWEDMKRQLESQREDAQAALEEYQRLQLQRGSRPSSAVRSRPGSALGGRRVSSTGGAAAGGAGSRPTSARPPPAPGSRPTSARLGAGAPLSAAGRPMSASRLPTAPEDSELVHEDLSPGNADLEAVTGDWSPAVSRPTSARHRYSGASPGTQSGAASPNVMSRPVSGRKARAGDSPGSSALAGAEGEDEVLADIAEEEIYDDEAEEEDLPALELEDSQELKRRIYPAHIVADLDAQNAAQLNAIRGEWERLLAETEEKNRKRREMLAKNKSLLEQFENDVLARYAESFVADVVVGGALKRAANELIMDAARDAWEALCRTIDEENRREADLHRKEVAEKQLREEQHRQAVSRWEADRTTALLMHEAEVVKARKLHAENVEAAKKEWSDRKAEVDALNEMRLKEAQAMHERMVEDIRELNKKYKAEYNDKVKARKAVEAENLQLLNEAKQRHKVQLEQLMIDNEDRVVLAQKEYEALCVRLEAEHIEAHAQALKDYEELKAYLTQHNEALLDDARKRYQEALLAVQQEHEEACKAIREAHALALERVRLHNEGIWPQVQLARLALAELGRVQAFAEHIRFCANKFEMGVNFMKDTPCYDRVVEMQALREALAKAFPDYHTKEYPWPDWEKKLEKGTGWTASPQAKSLVYKDPATEIMRIAQGRARAASAGRRPASAAAALQTPPADAASVAGGAPGAQRLQRGMSAGGAALNRSRSFAEAGYPMDADGSRPATAGASGAAGVQRPVSAGRQRFSSILARPATASAASSGGASRSKDLSAYTAAAGNRPMSAVTPSHTRPSSPYLGRQASPRGQQGNSPRLSNAAAGRPPSASKVLPARLAVDLSGMQATLNKLSKAAAAAGTRGPGASVLAGFTRDLPRLKYPEVDVQFLQ